MESIEPGLVDTESRSPAEVLQRLTEKLMPKLKLRHIEDESPVKLTVELPAPLHRDLLAYAEILGAEHGARPDPAKLIVPMLTRFIATDREFRKRAKRLPQQARDAQSAAENEGTFTPKKTTGIP
jgi:hypothetical protein